MWQERVGLYFAVLRNLYEFLKDVWNRTKIAAVAGRCASNLAAHIVENRESKLTQQRLIEVAIMTDKKRFLAIVHTKC
jgi:hypothetical protein